MKVTVLMENSTPNNRLCAKHGLSLFLETTSHKVLFDMGPDSSFLANAKALDIDVALADVAMLSHGHFDHGGGLGAYLDLTAEVEHPAPVYVHPRAFLKHFANGPTGFRDIGVDPSLAANPRIVPTGDSLRIDDELRLFADVTPKLFFPKSNAVLMEEIPEGILPDEFAHEQSLLVTENGKTTLVSGCSHCGIVNVINKAEQLTGGPLHAVIAGFHLMDPASGRLEDPSVTTEVARFLASRPTRYYTFHCTGLDAYGVLRDVLGDRINYLYAGSRVEV